MITAAPDVSSTGPAWPASVEAWREQARGCLPSFVFDHLDEGVEDGAAVRANRASVRQPRLVQRVLSGIERPEIPRWQVLDQLVPTPILLAPTGHHAFVHPDAERATVDGAGEVGAIAVISMASSLAFDEIASSAGAPLWLQLFPTRDRGALRDLVQQAVGMGYCGVVITVDTPQVGRFERSRSDPVADHLPVVEGTLARCFPRVAGVPDLLDPSAGWALVEALRTWCEVPLLVKGVQCAADARTAHQAGADAVYVSNHGGRSLGNAPGTLAMLREVVDELAGATTIVVDGGFERGSEVLAALALGAHAVAIGRPYLWGLAAAGSRGVAHVVSQLSDELHDAMVMAGVADPSSITSSIVRWPGGLPAP